MRNWHFNHIDFSTYPHYRGNDLGVKWFPDKTVFRLWAPTAKVVEIRLYAAGKGGRPERILPMTHDESGTWIHEEKGNLEGMYYTFKGNDGEWLHEVPDPYARAVGVNGHRGMIFNPVKCNPPGWETDKGPRPASFTDLIIYETHVRDFSISPSSGIVHKGLFLGFTEENSRSSSGMKTGLSHLLELGITHVHLMPVNDFQTVDEEFPLLKYNWGYDPQNFNAPEGSYATNPHDGTVRIRELKQLIKTLHDHGIGVILDVVYNHTWLQRIGFQPDRSGLFYRQNPDGSFSNTLPGCGNANAPGCMARKFITTPLYWIKVYHVDGPGFQMGIFDNEDHVNIRYEIDKKKRHFPVRRWTPTPAPCQSPRVKTSSISWDSGFQ